MAIGISKVHIRPSLHVTALKLQSVVRTCHFRTLVSSLLLPCSAKIDLIWKVRECGEHRMTLLYTLP